MGLVHECSKHPECRTQSSGGPSQWPEEGNIRATRVSAEVTAQTVKPCYKIQELGPVGEGGYKSQILNITERIMCHLTGRLSALTGSFI